MTNDPGDNEPTAQSRSAAQSPGQYQMPTWNWAGPETTRDLYGVPRAATVPEGPRSSVSRRARVLCVVAAVVLAGGSAAGGVAFGYAHSGASSSAAGIATGGGSPSQPGAQGQSPTAPPSAPPSTGGNGGHTQHQHRGGRPSSITVPGQATPSQQVGVVDINTRLKYLGAKAAGTGMILTSDGEILTNNHVVEGATKIKVIVVSTGDKYVATVVGTDKVDDIAVLQLSGASGLTPVTTDTGTVSVGDAVVAVGNAMGAGGVPSAAKGTVTGLNRSITTQSEGGVQGERLTGMIQVNAQVISGDSGGPLYDTDDQVIGMDTAASSSPAQSTGFAIPIARALLIATRMENGDAGGNISLGTPAFLGVQFRSGASYNQGGAGAVISGVLPRTPAAKAGLITGDAITKVDGTAITSGDQLKTVLSQYQPDQTVSLTWTDTQGGSHTATVKLIAGPAE